MSEVDGVKAINKVTFGQRLKAYKRSKLSFLLAVLVLFSAIITIGVLGYLIFYILIKGVPNLSPDLFSLTYTSENVSMIPAIINTLIMTILALLIAVPLGIFSAIYAPSNGILNSFLSAIGLGFLQQQWMGNPDIINYAIIAALVWQAIGYYMVMYMASMSSIPENLYEAAALEGAGKVKQFFMITLPLIWNNIRTTLTFFVISTINLSFMFVQLTSEGNLGSESALNYMYNNAFAGKYGFGMAVGACIFLFSFALSAILNKVTERDVLEY